MSILERLRSATAAEHESLEQRLDFMKPEFDLAAYRSTLHRFHEFYTELESAITERAHLLPADLSFEERRKTPALERDLAIVSQGPQEMIAPTVPQFSTRSELLGILYVVEGSTLGGQILSRHFHATLGLTPESGCEFFSGYGAETGRRWGEFRKILQREVQGEQDERSATTAACETFKLIGQHLLGH